VSLEQHLRSRLAGRSALLMAHAVVGYPSLDDNWAMLECMQESGVDIVELQLPFSEPIADGSWFIKANQGAIDLGITWDAYFEFVQRASSSFDIPILFMGYYNSIFKMGHDAFCARLADSGARGFIVADLPPEEAGDLNARARTVNLDPVLLMAPTNSDARLKEVGAAASGFVYCVARKGVTGKHTKLTSEVESFLERCRQGTSLPLALGFGIKTPEDVAAASQIADIAIVGTACLQEWERTGRAGYLEFLRGLVGATE